MSRLEELPEECALEVLARTDLRAIQEGVRRASKRLEALSRTPLLWREKLSRDFGLEKLSTSVSEGSVEELYKSIKDSLDVQGSHQWDPITVDYEGVFTDGGCDAKNLHYWVGNAFFTGLSDCFCSEKGRNVHCVAEMADFMGGKSALEIRQEYRELLLSRCQPLIDFIRRQDPEDGIMLSSQITSWTTERLAAFLRQAFEEFLRGSPIMASILMDIPPHYRRNAVLLMRDLVSASCPHLVGQGERKIVFPNQGKNDVVCINRLIQPPAVLRKCGQGKLSIISEIEISRHGDFSCPVACGAVFLSAYNYGCASRSFTDILTSSLCQGFSGALDDLTSLDEVVSMAGIRLPRVRSVQSSNAGEWVEFQTPVQDRPGQLHLKDIIDADAVEFWPVVWFKFKDRASMMDAEGIPPRDSPSPGEHRFESYNTIRMSLSNIHIGNVVCIKLINQENLMQLYLDDHEAPNVDLRTVSLFGQTCSFDWQASG